MLAASLKTDLVDDQSRLEYTLHILRALRDMAMQGEDRFGAYLIEVAALYVTDRLSGVDPVPSPPEEVMAKCDRCGRTIMIQNA